MEWLKKTNDVVYNVVKGIAIAMFATMVGLCIMQVIYRYVLKLPLSFSEELARFLFIWVTFLGTAMALKQGKHVKMELLIQTFPKVVQKVISVMVFVLSICTYGIMIYSGIEVMKRTMTQTSAALGIPMGYIYMSVPLCAFIMILFEIGKFMNKKSDVKEEEK